MKIVVNCSRKAILVCIYTMHKRVCFPTAVSNFHWFHRWKTVFQWCIYLTLMSKFEYFSRYKDYFYMYFFSEVSVQCLFPHFSIRFLFYLEVLKVCYILGIAPLHQWYMLQTCSPSFLSVQWIYGGTLSYRDYFPLCLDWFVNIFITKMAFHTWSLKRILWCFLLVFQYYQFLNILSLIHLKFILMNDLKYGFNFIFF